jgi:uncharacterized protein with FMN-binding domain
MDKDRSPMTDRPRDPARLPVRGSLALAGTIGAMALLLSFKGSPLNPAAAEVFGAEPADASALPSGTTGDGVAAASSRPAAGATPTADAAGTATDAAAGSGLAADVPTAAATPAASAPVTVTGDAYSFRFGTVQVAVTVDGTDITDVQALSLPEGDRHSAQISAYADPILRGEAISADSASISVISGATCTSRAYAASLQSALDQLGL